MSLARVSRAPHKQPTLGERISAWQSAYRAVIEEMERNLPVRMVHGDKESALLRFSEVAADIATRLVSGIDTRVP